MNSVLRWPGGKSRKSIREWILSHRPPGVQEFREPFVGGGGVFFAADGFRRRWINDLNAGLMAVYTALRDRPADFIGRCRAVQPERLQAEFDRVVADQDADPAYRFYLVNRTVYGGLVQPALPCRTRFRDASGWNIVAGDQLELAAARLAGVRLTCGDFAQLLAEPGKGVWIYADPPYVTSRTWPAARVYEHHFTEADHVRLADSVKRGPHKVAVSYGDDPAGFVRSLYPKSDGFHVIEAAWHYGFTTDAVKRPGRELLILNYPPPAGAVTLRAPDRVPVARPRRPVDQAKRQAVLALLDNPTSAAWSVARLAEAAGVSWTFADKTVRDRGVTRSTVQGANGRTYAARLAG